LQTQNCNGGQIDQASMPQRSPCEGAP
jgi:hypothetical protein